MSKNNIWHLVVSSYADARKQLISELRRGEVFSLNNKESFRPVEGADTTPPHDLDMDLVIKI